MAKARAGFTLLELLVVIALISLLIALALPAVQRVRAAAARASCANNLRQIGLALHGYHDSQNVLPPGCSYRGGADPYPHMSWLTRLLPYLEQEALWEQAQQAFGQEKFFEKGPHLPILGKVVAVFTCPADGRTRSPGDFGVFKAGLTSFLGVGGTDHIRQDGVLYLDSTVRLSDIIDGTSVTLAAGERPPSARKNYGWWYAGWGQSKEGSADMVLGVRELNVDVTLPKCPKGPYPFVAGSVDNQCDTFHFWSLHSGGAHFLFADGSVHFLAYSADSILPQLATRAGGEQVQLPD